MKPTEVIYLNRADSIESIRELLASATPGAQVWLVAPWRMRLTHDLLRLKLIARVARSNALDLRLVTMHANTRLLAHEAGIPAYAWVPWRLRSYRRQRRKDAAGLAARVLPVGEDIGRRGRRRPRHLGLGSVLWALLGTMIVVGLAAGTLLLLIPRAEVTLQPVARDVDVAFTATGNPRVVSTDYGRAIVPARRVQVIVTGRAQVPASGSVEEPGERASGEVVLVNRTREEVLVPKGTIVRSAEGRGVRFYTVADVVLPPELFAHRRVGILALEPGRSGNVNALTITVVEGELANRVEVINDAPTRGGTNDVVLVVMAEDINALRDTLEEQLQLQAYQELKDEVEQGEFVPVQSMDAPQVMSFVPDQSPGERRDYVSGEMRMVTRALAVDGDALDDLAIRMLEAQTDDAFRVLPDSLVVIRAPQAEYTGDVLIFEVVASASLGPSVTEAQVRSWVRGKAPADAAELLAERIELAAEPRFQISPGWWERLPILPGRMDVLMTAAG